MGKNRLRKQNKNFQKSKSSFDSPEISSPSILMLDIMESITNYTREDALEANEEKMKIEAEISDWKSVLDSEGNVGMDGKLVDEEGYPRNDIDIPKVRLARQKIICLSNDHKDIMKKISEALISIHAKNQVESFSPESIPSSAELPKAFARIDYVNPGS